MSLMGITATCAGRITKQGLRTFQAGGETYCGFSLAVTPRVKVQGTWQNGPKLFIRCTVWDKYLAAHAINSLQAGDNVIVSGSITTEEYQGQTNLNMGVEALGLDLSWNDASPTRDQQQASGGGYADAADDFGEPNF